MTDSLHARLREATAEAHAALERDLDWEARVATLSGYRDLLGRLRGFHASYEPAIADALNEAAFFDPRRRLTALDTDLRILSSEDTALGALPAPSRPRLDGKGGALGALYVLEGSALGGTVIGRHVARLHGDNVPLAYYAGRGRAVGPLWRSFRQRLDDLADGEAPVAFAAGITTFEALRHWLVNGTG